MSIGAVAAATAAWVDFRPIGLVILISIGTYLGYSLLLEIRQLVLVISRHHAERPLPFSSEEIQTQKRIAERANKEAFALFSELPERFGGRVLNAIEAEEAARFNRNVEYAQQKANREVEKLALMVQANGKVWAGTELQSIAYAHVHKSYNDGIHKDLREYIEGEKHRSAVED